MRVYELALILRSSLSEEKRKKLLETVKGWLGSIKIIKEDQWGQKVLSYPIKKEESGFYTLLSLETETSVPLDFEKKLFGQEDILRHLLIRRK